MSRADLLDEPRPRRLQLVRRDDVSGMSGTGIVAEGIEHRDGSVQYHWLTAPSTWQMAQSVHDIEHIHGHNGKTTVRYLDDPGPPGETKSLTEVYEDRNALALAFGAIADRAPGFEAGWSEPAANDADADEWGIVWVDSPEGQLSWHVRRSAVENSILSQEAYEWDGHSRKEKNNRLLSLFSLE